MSTQPDVSIKSHQFTLHALMTWIAVLAFIWAIPSFLPSFTIGSVLATIVYAGFISQRVTGWKLFRNIATGVVLIFCGFHFLLTGIPFPIWHIERLRSPVAVVEVSSVSLNLADGRRISLPLIKEIPADDPVFNLALQYGVEISDNGEVYGLARWPRFCANDAVVVNIRRINLSELAGAVSPKGIDDRIVDSVEITRLANNPSTWRGHLPIDRLHDVQEVFAKVDRRQR